MPVAVPCYLWAALDCSGRYGRVGTGWHMRCGQTPLFPPSMFQILHIGITIAICINPLYHGLRDNVNRLCTHIATACAPDGQPLCRQSDRRRRVHVVRACYAVRSCDTRRAVVCMPLSMTLPCRRFAPCGARYRAGRAGLIP